MQVGRATPAAAAALPAAGRPGHVAPGYEGDGESSRRRLMTAEFYRGAPSSAPSPPRRCCREAAWSPPPSPRAAPRRTPSPAASSSRSRSEPGTPRSRPRAWVRRPRSARRSEDARPAPPPPAPAAPPGTARRARCRPRISPRRPSGKTSGDSTVSGYGRLRSPVNWASCSVASPSFTHLASVPRLLFAPAEHCATDACVVRRPRGARRTLDPHFHIYSLTKTLWCP